MGKKQAPPTYGETVEVDRNAVPMQPGQPMPPQVALQMNSPRAIANGEQYHNAMMAQCAQGNHSWETKRGACGIITGIACFP